MKKVLIITNLFHASPRIPGLTKYLPEFGWEPIVLTIPIGKNDDVRPYGRYIEVPYDNVAKMTYERRSSGFKKQIKNQRLRNLLYNLYGALFYYPDSEKGWQKPALKAAIDLIKNEKIDAIISSSSPVTCHLIAQNLKTKYGIPWIADLRDLWTQNHNYSYGYIRKLIDRRLEVKTFSYANALVTLASIWAQKLKVLHDRDFVFTITNGFDPDNISDGIDTLTPNFTITYTGSLYADQSPQKFFQAVKELIDEKIINPVDIEVRFFGDKHQFLTNFINKFKLSNIIKIYGKISRIESFEKQKESQILIHFTWEGKVTAGYALKLFEYLAARRPIIATGLGYDLTKSLLEETKSGVFAPNVEDIKKVLHEFYDEYKHTGKVSYIGDLKEINKYSYREIARNFCNLLNDFEKNKISPR